MIKKILLLLIAIVCFASCDWEYCKRCGEFRRDCVCHNTYHSDYFCAETLIGIWQMHTVVGTVELKEIEFFDGHKCDITYSEGRDPDWFTDTYTYTFTSGYIKFNKGRSSFSFKVKDFIFPSLWVKDSFGTYEWRKTR